MSSTVMLFALVVYNYSDLSSYTMRYYDTHSACQVAKHSTNDTLDKYRYIAECVMVEIK